MRICKCAGCGKIFQIDDKEGVLYTSNSQKFPDYCGACEVPKIVYLTPLRYFSTGYSKDFEKYMK